MHKIETVLIENYDERELASIKEIFNGLVKSGGLTGVKGGTTILHFDSEGTFMGVQLSYWPYRRKKQ